jgi:hypothetical protein
MRFPATGPRCDASTLSDCGVEVRISTLGNRLDGRVGRTRHGLGGQFALGKFGLDDGPKRSIFPVARRFILSRRFGLSAFPQRFHIGLLTFDCLKWLRPSGHPQACQIGLARLIVGQVHKIGHRINPKDGWSNDCSATTETAARWLGASAEEHMGEATAKMPDAKNYWP